jgi:ankyrin repeat protein
MEGGSSTEASAEASVEQPKAKLESTPELVSLLQDAAHDGDLKGVEKAIESGVDVNGMDEEGRTALMFAGFNGHSEIVLKLLDAESGIDRRDMMGRTALLYAATGPFPETVQILLDKGAEPNVVDSDEHFSPLMHAAAEGNLDVVKILLEAGSDATLQDVDGDNAASFARQAGHIEVANYLEAFTNLKE